MSWKAIAMGRGFDEGEDRELEEAYQEGMRKGYEKAMREMEGGRYGEREGRMFDPYDRDYPDMDGRYGERRGVKGSGPYGGEYLRRRR